MNGILFNHESPRRGPTFVSRKITLGVSNIYNKKQDKLYLGNLDAKRDWGYAKEYVVAMWQMLQHDNPEDFVISTGESYTVREFVEESFKFVGINIEWSGSGLDEVGKNSENGDILVEIDSYFFRPLEVDYLKGNSQKARDILGWKASTNFKDLVSIMMQADLS